jgi:hypothetical protein
MFLIQQAAKRRSYEFLRQYGAICYYKMPTFAR